MTTMPPPTPVPAPDKTELVEMTIVIGAAETVARARGQALTPEAAVEALRSRFPAERVEAFLGCSLLYLLGAVTIGDLFKLADAAAGDPR